jgi:hypothetical protein
MGMKRPPLPKTHAAKDSKEQSEKPAAAGKSDANETSTSRFFFKNNKLVALVAGGLVLVVLLLMVISVTGLAVAAYVLRPQLAAGDNEIRSKEILHSQYEQWISARQELAAISPDSTTAAESQASAEETPTKHILGSIPEGGKSVGTLDTWLRLPANDAAEDALKSRITDSFRIIELEPVAYAIDEDSMWITYLVTLRARYEMFWADFDRISVLDATLWEAKLYPLLLASTDLAPGYTYSLEGAPQAFTQGEELSFYWVVDGYEKQDGQWALVTAEPVPVQQDPAFENMVLRDKRLRDQSFLRSSAQLAAELEIQNRAVREFGDRMVVIESDSAAQREKLLAAVGPKPQMSDAKFGGSGSGEPTRTAARVGGGAASGAAVGAVADGGSGAGWGALAGAGAGAIYDIFSKSSDKKKFQQQKQSAYQKASSAYQSRMNTAQSQAKSFEINQYKAYQAELEAAAAERTQQLSLFR